MRDFPLFRLSSMSSCIYVSTHSTGFNSPTDSLIEIRKLKPLLTTFCVHLVHILLS